MEDSTLKMEPHGSSKALVTTYQTTLYHNPKDHNISDLTKTSFNKIHMQVKKRGGGGGEDTLMSENIFVKFLSSFDPVHELTEEIPKNAKSIDSM
jgi:hypothetical protein